MANLGGCAFTQEGTSVGFKVGEHDAAEIRSANMADIVDDFVHRLEEVLGAAELDTSFQNIRCRLSREVRHLVGARFGRKFLRVGAVAFIRVIEI